MTAVEAITQRLKDVEEKLAKAPEVRDSFHKCFLNTAQTTLSAMPDGTSFVITGDIPAMWLRDSTAQVLHYLRFSDMPEIASLIEGLIHRHAYSILLDPYANAFNMEANGAKYTADEPEQDPEVWERKFEVDSLCYPVMLIWKYYEVRGNLDFLGERECNALKKIYDVFRTERHPQSSPYYFIRRNCPPQDTMPCEGRGEPLAYTGMIRSGFRPSDDACRYGYLVPSNLFAAKTLERIAAIMRIKGWEQGLAEECESMSREVLEGVAKYAVISGEKDIYAYETDGMGKQLFMDDANVPSLLSLPYLEVCAADDPLYLSTRNAVLSHANPYYYEGKAASGVGSPHTPQGYVWHIGIAMRALTSKDDEEVYAALKLLLTTTAGTGFMHEGFDCNDPEKFTRPWFAWANSLFAELIYTLYEDGRLEGMIERFAKESK